MFSLLCCFPDLRWSPKLLFASQGSRVFLFKFPSLKTKQRSRVGTQKSSNKTEFNKKGKKRRERREGEGRGIDIHKDKNVNISGGGFTYNPL